jgi:ribosomal protein L37AE/L43A
MNKVAKVIAELKHQKHVACKSCGADNYYNSKNWIFRTWTCDKCYDNLTDNDIISVTEDEQQKTVIDTWIKK